MTAKAQFFRMPQVRARIAAPVRILNAGRHAARTGLQFTGMANAPTSKTASKYDEYSYLIKEHKTTYDYLAKHLKFSLPVNLLLFRFYLNSMFKYGYCGGDHWFHNCFNPMFEQNPELLKHENIPVLRLILRSGLEGSERHMGAGDLFQYCLVPLLKQNPELARTRNMAALKEFIDFFVEIGEKANKEDIHEDTLFGDNIRTLLLLNPAFARSENIPQFRSVINVLFELCRKAHECNINEAQFLDSCINTCFEMDPSLAFPENSARLRALGELFIALADQSGGNSIFANLHNGDNSFGSCYYIFGIEPLIISNPSLIKGPDLSELKELGEAVIDISGDAKASGQDARDMLIYVFRTLIEANPDLAKAGNIPHLKTLYQFCISAGIKSKLPEGYPIKSFYEYVIHELVRFDPALARVENLADLQQFTDYFIDLGERAGRNGIKADELYHQGTMYIITRNPELCKIENFEHLKAFCEYYLDLAVRIKALGVEDPTSLLVQSQRHIVDGDPSMLLPENIDQYKAFGEYLLELIKLAKERNMDAELLLNDGFCWILGQNDSMSKIKNMDQLRRFMDIFLDSGIVTKEYMFSVWHAYFWTMTVFLGINPSFTQIENIDKCKAASDLLAKLINKAIEKGMLANVLCRTLIVDGYFDSDRSIAEPQNFHKLDRVVDLAVSLMDRGIFPTFYLIDLLSRGLISIDALAARYKELYLKSSMTGTMFSLSKDQVDMDINFSILMAKLGHDEHFPEPRQFKKMHDMIFTWMNEHPSYASLNNPLPPFVVSGKGDVEIRDTTFDRRLIDGHIAALEEDIKKAGFKDLTFLSNLRPAEQLHFAARVLAHLQVQKAIRDGKLPKTFKITGPALKRHVEERCPEQFRGKTLQTLLMEINSFNVSDISVATYFNCISAMMDAQNNKDAAKKKYYQDIIALLLLSDGVNDEHMNGILHSGAYKTKLMILSQIYRDRVKHIPETSLPIPKDIDGIMNRRFGELSGEYQKIGAAMNKANVQEYAIAPAGMEALFRGFIGGDCTTGEHIAVWAFNPNNLYMMIRKGDRSKGYIGMTKCVSPQGKKLILVDTMQPCPAGLVEPILRTLNKIAIDMGYDGLAIGEKLNGSFNYAETVSAVLKLDAYQNGIKIKLRPEDESSWKYFEDEICKDNYHAMNLNEAFVMLDFSNAASD